MISGKEEKKVMNSTIQTTLSSQIQNQPNFGFEAKDKIYEKFPILNGLTIDRFLTMSGADFKEFDRGFQLCQKLVETKNIKIT
jgi:hypothetical protein